MCVAQFEGMPGVAVPEVVEELSTSRVLTTTFAKGAHIDRTAHLPQDVRNSIARRLLQLTLQVAITSGVI
jgi:predicted unusual protein kinase regulating ubiquinone biosynthesis (AarF/ABC1/UbiB family)